MVSIKIGRLNVTKTSNTCKSQNKFEHYNQMCYNYNNETNDYKYKKKNKATWKTHIAAHLGYSSDQANDAASLGR